MIIIIIILPSFSFLSASQPGVFDRVVVNDSVDVAYDELQKYIEEVLMYFEFCVTCNNREMYLSFCVSIFPPQNIGLKR